MMSHEAVAMNSRIRMRSRMESRGYFESGMYATVHAMLISHVNSEPIVQ